MVYSSCLCDFTHTLLNTLMSCVVCSFVKAIGFLGQEVTASVSAGGGSDKMSKAAKQILKDKFKVRSHPSLTHSLSYYLPPSLAPFLPPSLTHSPSSSLPPSLPHPPLSLPHSISPYVPGIQYGDRGAVQSAAALVHPRQCTQV